MLVWRDDFPDWKRAADVEELRAQTIAPPLLPQTQPTTQTSGEQNGGSGLDRADIIRWVTIVGAANLVGVALIYIGGAVVGSTILYGWVFIWALIIIGAYLTLRKLGLWRAERSSTDHDGMIAIPIFVCLFVLFDPRDRGLGCRT